MFIIVIDSLTVVSKIIVIFENRGILLTTVYCSSLTWGDLYNVEQSVQRNRIIRVNFENEVLFEFPIGRRREGTK